ncbi:MAG: metallophosphoesterase family protein, partial [Candidatus Paceibacterota bacterium]
MKIAIFSDSHDHLDHLQAAITYVKAQGITTVLHLGDFCAPPVFEVLGESGLQWYGVWGNVDGDRLMCWLRVKDAGNVDIGTDDFRELEIGGRKLFLTHYPRIAQIAAASGEFDAAFHGHDHIAAAELIKTNGGPHS